MTNWDKWQSYTDSLPSPQNYIDWSWLYLVGAALQRRVWLGPSHQPLFPNKYVILVGEPGVGKGLPIREVSTFLKHWKKKDCIRLDSKTLSPAQMESVALTMESDVQTASEKEYQGKAKGADLIEPLLFPVAADATTYEALVGAVGDSYSRCNYVELNEKTNQNVLKIYGHSSICFCLQELASLMRKRTEDTINYMLGLYDCPIDYEYITVSRGKDRVRRGCINLLAGTTPSFMQSTFDDKLADEGFNSRAFYIYAQRNRKPVFSMPLLTKEQEQHKTEMLDHIRQLSGLYGNVKFGPGAFEWLQNWWHDYETHPAKRKNQSVKLKAYYARRQIHVQKLAMAMHFGESLEMEIPLETFQKAMSFLDKEEMNMHLAITIEGDNPHGKLCKRLLEILRISEKNFVDLLIEGHPAKKQDIMEALEFLETSCQVRSESRKDDDQETTTMFWSIR